MKRNLIIVVGVVAVVVVLLVITSFTGFEPTSRFPGLWLKKGELVTTPVTNWDFTNKYDTIMVQVHTRHLLPESVTVRCNTDSKGNLYISAIYLEGMQFPVDKSWVTNVMRNPHVRIKIGNQLFDKVLSHETDPAILAELSVAKNKKYHWRALPGTVIHWFLVVPDGTAQATATRPN